MDNQHLGAAPGLPQLTGDEVLTGVGATVRDFWAFAMSDLRTNNTRGYLAEFIVQRALGVTGPRVEWDAFDVLTHEGLRVEVKASGYLQVWDQRKPSAIRFSGLLGRAWTSDTGRATEAAYNADVFVFCVQTATRHRDYRPLDLSQWDFYVVPAVVVAATAQASIGLTRVAALAGGPVSYGDLGHRVRGAGKPG